MQKAWNVIKVYDGTTPDLTFNKQNRNLREKLIDHARRYLPPFNEEITRTAFSRNVSQLSVKQLSVKHHFCDAAWTR